MSIPFWVGSYIGLHFKQHGRTLKDGFDCWGLVRHVHRAQYGINLPSYAEYYKTTSSEAEISPLITIESEAWIKIEDAFVKEGDVVVLRMRGFPLHVGIVVGDNKFLHISKDINSTIEDYTISRWRNRIVGFYRYYDI